MATLAWLVVDIYRSISSGAAWVDAGVLFAAWLNYRGHPIAAAAVVFAIVVELVVRIHLEYMRDRAEADG